MTHAFGIARQWAVYCVLLMACGWGGVVTAGETNLIITLDQSDVQRRVERLFPIVQEEASLKVRWHDPEVILHEGSDRIGLRLQLALMSAPYQFSATAEVEGKLRFERKTGELFLDDARIIDLAFTDVPMLPLEPIVQIAETMLRPGLQSHPVYVLGQSGEEKRFMGSEIKSVAVRDGKLEITLAMP